MESVENRIRQRNQDLLELKREAEELVVEFYDENREEIDKMVRRNEKRAEIIEENEDRLTETFFDLEEVVEEKVPELDQNPRKDMEEFVETRSDFKFTLGRKPMKTVERARDNELGLGRLIADSPETYELEMENYIDYFQLVGEEVRDILGEDINAAYIGGGHDFVPAAEIGGDWKYIGLEDERSASYGDAEIEVIEQDLEGGDLPQVDDGSLDLVMIKTPGSVVDEDLREDFLDVAYDKLNEGGLLLTDIDVEDTTGYRPLGDIEPAPESFVQGLSDPNEGGRIYPTSGLSSYLKKG